MGGQMDNNLLELHNAVILCGLQERDIRDEIGAIQI
jgi:hypothetical protein